MTERDSAATDAGAAAIPSMAYWYRTIDLAV
jgi:hypothetical protein